jgi:hypothetical protein
MSIHLRHASAPPRDGAPAAGRPRGAEPAARRAVRVRVELGWRPGDAALDAAPLWSLFERADDALLRAATGAFAPGCAVATPDGRRSVEDLIPGDAVLDAQGRPARIAWTGAATRPAAPPCGIDGGPGPGEAPLLRVAAHSLGAGLPEADIVLGAQAHVLISTGALREATGAEAAYVPLAALVDGIGIAPVTPPGPVTVYGLATGCDHAIPVAGLPVAAFHPAQLGRGEMVGGLAGLSALFPQLATGPGFGPPRLPRLGAEAAHALF